MITIRQPVAVKLVLTETAKQQILVETRRQIDEVTNELEQLDAQGRQALAQAMAQGGEVAQQLRTQLEQEKFNRVQKREQLMQHMQQIQQMDLGTELPTMNVETTIDVRVGDDWNTILRGTEIVVKDGIVEDIRRAGDSLKD